MINAKNIEDTVSTITKSAETIIEGMPDGSRFTTKDFVKQIVDETNIPVAIVTGITSLIINNCPSVKQRAGRSGGIFKLASEANSLNKKMSAVAASILVQNMNQPAVNNDDVGEEGIGE